MIHSIAIYDPKHKEETGRVIVSRKENQESNYFFARMKKQYRLYQENKSQSSLSEEQAKKLADVGFGDESLVSFTNLARKSRPWDEMFQELLEFHKNHGHVRVPKSSLFHWIQTQRANYERLKEGKQNSCLNPERMAKLQSIDFSFESEKRLPFSERALQWLEYKNKHRRDPSDNLLGVGSWTRKMRIYYRAHKEGKKVPITQEQFDQLDEWGFTWETGMAKPETVAKRKTWEERYQELLAYKAEHGHVNVPKKYPILGSWVHRQRKEYAKMKDGVDSTRRKSIMKPEQIEKLKEIGFKFITRKRPKKSNGEERQAFSDDDDDGSSSSEDDNDNDQEPYAASWTRNQYRYI